MALSYVSLVSFVLAIPAKMKEEDKRKHVVWSFCLVLVALPFMSLAAAAILVFFVGLAKEYWDQMFGSGFCLFDLAGNLVGIAAAAAILILCF